MVLSRRTVVAATALLPIAGWAAVPAAHAAPEQQPPQPPIRPRPDWAANLPVRGALEEETDVRFLLVHHTLTPNDDGADEVAGRLRSIFRFHTGERGWPDVAYNFFVDRFGTIWEGREGSLTRAVRGDATGGSQGFALLCCFVGDFSAVEPTPEAMAAMTGLLAWLAGREGLDLAAPVTFASRGSSRWRRGAEVTTDQVAGHRDMSLTECPGDALYPLVRSRLLPDARALLGAASASATPEATATPSAVPTPEPTPEPAPTPEPGPAPTPAVGDEVLRGVGGGALLVGLGGVLALGRRRRGSARDEPEDDDRAADGQGGEEPEEETDGRP